MNIQGPILSTTAVTSLATAAAVITFIIVVFGSTRELKVDPSETAAIAATCQAKGLVARHEVGGGYIRTFCQKPEEVK